MRRTLIMAAAALTCALPSWSARAQEEKDPIDAQVDKMIEADDSTAGQVQALDKGVKLWDAELNRVYAKLLASLPKADAEVLKSSQRAWIAYRDTDLKALRQIFGNAEGTMYRPMAVRQHLELIKNRVLALRGYQDAQDSHPQD